MAVRVRHTYSKVATVIEAARLVRNSFEQVDFDIHSTIDPVDLCGACGIASFALSRILRRVGVACDFVMGRFYDPENQHGLEHCWVELPKHDIIVDVTATQFGVGSTVHVTSTKDSHYRGTWENRQAVRELETWDDQSHLSHERLLDRIVNDCVEQLWQSGFLLGKG